MSFVLGCVWERKEGAVESFPDVVYYEISIRTEP